MNGASKIYRTQNAEIAVDRILDVGGFDLNRALQEDPKFLEPEYPFEWVGLYQPDAGAYKVALPKFTDDETMDIAVLPLGAATFNALEDELMRAVLIFSEPEEIPVAEGRVLAPDGRLYQLQLRHPAMEYSLTIPKAGAYALFTEHHPANLTYKCARPVESSNL